METEEIIQHILFLDSKARSIKATDDAMVDSRKFYAGKIDIPACAKLHGKDPRTIKYYVDLGLIEKHPDSTEHHTYLNGQDALLLDFPKLNRQARYTKKQRP